MSIGIFGHCRPSFHDCGYSNASIDTQFTMSTEVIEGHQGLQQQMMTPPPERVAEDPSGSKLPDAAGSVVEQPAAIPPPPVPSSHDG